jgi:hypothetical protein
MVIMNTKYLTIPWDLLWFADEIESFLVFAMVKVLSYNILNNDTINILFLCSLSF